MPELLDIVPYVLLALVASLALPAVMALVLGVYAAWRGRRDDDAVEKIVGDYPAVPPQEKQ